MKLKQLTPEEEKVIVDKGTEKPFSGEYVSLFVAGTYVCRRCGQPSINQKANSMLAVGGPALMMK